MKFRMLMFQFALGINALAWLCVIGALSRSAQTQTLFGVAIAGTIIALFVQHYAFRNLRRPELFEARGPRSFVLDPPA